MKRFWLVAVLAGLAAGCASQNRYASMGYIVTDDDEPGCAFRYGYYPYYDSGAGGLSSPARMDIVRVERLRFPREVGHGIDVWGHRGDAAFAGNPGAVDSGSAAATAVERAPVMTAAPPPPPRVVGPRS